MKKLLTLALSLSLCCGMLAFTACKMKDSKPHSSESTPVSESSSSSSETSSELSGSDESSASPSDTISPSDVID